MSDKEKLEAIMDMFREVQGALESLPSSSLGKEEVRYMIFTGIETLPSGYERANGQRGTYSVENGDIPTIPIQKVK